MAYKHTLRIDVRCQKHIRFNPEKDGPGAIRGACPDCTVMWEIYQSSRKLDILVGNSGLKRFKQREER